MCIPDPLSSTLVMSLDPTWLALFLTPAMTGIVVAMCITSALSDYVYRLRHCVPEGEEQAATRATLRRRKHILMGAIWSCTLLGIGIMMVYFRS